MSEVSLSKVLTEKAVILDKDSFFDKETMFTFLTDKLQQSGIIKSSDDFITALNDREKLGPTYMGNFIAIPHGKSETVINPGIAFCRCTTPFVYKSADTSGEVKYIFMLAIPGSQAANDYLRILAILSGMLIHQEFIDALENVISYEELMNIIKEWQ